MSGPIVQLDPEQLWSHGHRASARAADYYADYPPLIAQDGWPSQQAYADGHESMAGAGRSFAARQDARGQAVGAAANGFVGNDNDSAKLIQALGSVLGPGLQALASAFQGGVQGLAQLGSQTMTAGAQALGSMLTAGGSLLSKASPASVAGAGSTPVVGGAGVGAGSGAGSSATQPAAGLGPSSAPYQGRHRAPEPTEEHKVVPVSALATMSGMGGIPMGRSTEGGVGTKVTTKRIVTGDESDPITEPLSGVVARAQIRAT
jgi:hypothetical protein